MSRRIARVTKGRSIPAYRRQQGVALIVALLVLAIATGLAATMIVRNQNAIGTTSALINGARADELASSALVLAQALLDRDDRHVDGPADPWAQPLTGIPVDAATMSLRVIDLQGRFNLNSLITAEDKVDLVAKTRFQHLLSALHIQTDISNALIDWISRNPNLEPLSQTSTPDTPFVPAGRPMQSVTELRALPGVTPDIYRRLAPYVTTLPIGTPINLNSAPSPVLIALGADRLSTGGRMDQGVSQDASPSVGPAVDNLGQAGPTIRQNIGSVANFLAQPLFGGKTVPTEGLAVNSGYFLCVVTVHLDTVIRRRYAIIERPMTGPSRIIALSSEACLNGFYCL